MNHFCFRNTLQFYLLIVGDDPDLSFPLRNIQLSFSSIAFLSNLPIWFMHSFRYLRCLFALIQPIILGIDQPIKELTITLYD